MRCCLPLPAAACPLLPCCCRPAQVFEATLTFREAYPASASASDFHKSLQLYRAGACVGAVGTVCVGGLGETGRLGGGADWGGNAYC